MWIKPDFAASTNQAKVEFIVLVADESLIKKTNVVKDFAAVRAKRKSVYKLRRVGIAKGSTSHAKRRTLGDGNSTRHPSLSNCNDGTTDAISIHLAQGFYASVDVIICDDRMTIYANDNLSLRSTDTIILSCRYDLAWIIKQTHAWIPVGKRRHDVSRAIFGHSIYHQDLDSLARVILADDGFKTASDITRLIPNRQDDGDQREVISHQNSVFGIQWAVISHQFVRVNESMSA